MGMAPGRLVGDGIFRDDVVRLASLTVTSPWLENLTFINCQIIGPAVLAIQENVEISNSEFEADVNSIFWVVPDDRPQVFGAVGVRNCTFSACTFRSVGFAGPVGLRDAFDHGLTDAD